MSGHATLSTAINSFCYTKCCDNDMFCSFVIFQKEPALDYYYYYCCYHHTTTAATATITATIIISATLVSVCCSAREQWRLSVRRLNCCRTMNASAVCARQPVSCPQLHALAPPVSILCATV